MIARALRAVPIPRPISGSNVSLASCAIRPDLRWFSSLPPRIVEPHHHYVGSGSPFHGNLKALGVPEYTPEQFVKDAHGVDIVKAVHLECMPTDPLGEAEWVEDIVATKRSPVVAIVAACDLAAEDAEDQLAVLKAKCPNVVGIRYIVDYTGPWGEGLATHIAVTRHDPSGSIGPVLSGKGVDFLRDEALARQFESGYARLAEYGWRFDLQCAPEQLPAAARLVGRHPEVPVVLDHLGKPRLGSGDAAADAAELARWREGMAMLAMREHVFVKLSMLGYSVPGWAGDSDKEELIASLVREVIDLFGPDRCMFSTNWWSDGAMSNSDGRDKVAISMAELWGRYHDWVKGRYPEEDVRKLFSGTAERFYGI